ncbi:Uncharacterised protein [Klebsiella pneumoniae]|nr:Uncharacterised protein [Klebsiella pneumoniae]
MIFTFGLSQIGAVDNIQHLVEKHRHKNKKQDPADSINRRHQRCRHRRHKLQNVIDDNNRNEIGQLFGDTSILLQRHILFVATKEDLTHHFNQQELA